MAKSEVRSEVQRAIATEIGQRIRNLRAARKMSQEKLSRAMDMSRETVRAAEAGEHIPNWDTLEAMAEALGVELWDLVPIATEVTGQAHTRYFAQIPAGLDVRSSPAATDRTHRQRRARVAPERRTAVKVPA